MILTEDKLFALGWALNSSGWLDKPLKDLTTDKLRGINKKLGGLKINFTEGKQWDSGIEDYVDNADYMVVWLERGDDIKLINVRIKND